MRTVVVVAILGLIALFFYHQYRYAGPYDTLLRDHPVPADTVINQLAQWRYHDYVSFEWVPDALTTAFKRVGIGGWSETGHRVCVTGCPYWTEAWTDGFYTVDLEIESFAIGSNPAQTFAEPRYMDVEIWGGIRNALAKDDRLPQVGRRTHICGPLRIDRPYHVYTIQPDTADDIQNLDACHVMPKRNPEALSLVKNHSCEQIRQGSLGDQMALIDALADSPQNTSTTAAIEKVMGCVQPAVLRALSTNADVSARLIALAPAIQTRLPHVTADTSTHQGTPVLNTIRDWWEHFSWRKELKE